METLKYSRSEAKKRQLKFVKTFGGKRSKCCPRINEKRPVNIFLATSPTTATLRWGLFTVFPFNKLLIPHRLALCKEEVRWTFLKWFNGIKYFALPRILRLRDRFKQRFALVFHLSNLSYGKHPKCFPLAVFNTMHWNHLRKPRILNIRGQKCGSVAVTLFFYIVLIDDVFAKLSE